MRVLRGHFRSLQEGRFYKFCVLAAFSLMLATLCPREGHSQSSPDEEARRTPLRSVTSAIAVFATDDGVTGGSYDFKNKGASDLELDMYKFVGEFSLGDPHAQFVPLIEVSPATMRIKQDITNGSAEVDTWNVGVGAGLRMKFFDKLLEVTPRLKVDYSEIDYTYKLDGVDDDLVDQFIPDVDAWTYLPSLEAVVRQEVSENGPLFAFSSRISYLFVDASTSRETLDDFSDKSWIWKNSISYEQPVQVGESFGKVYVRPTVGRVDIYGAARTGFEFSNFYEFGLDLLSRSVAPDYLKEVGLTATYVYEKEVQGWRLGVIVHLA
jgi:hypothetical protein